MARCALLLLGALAAFASTAAASAAESALRGASASASATGEQPASTAGHSARPFVGVNLGGWLLLENWMWYSELGWDKGIDDEWTFIQVHGGPTAEAAKSKMHAHWDTFVTKERLATLHDFGITHVRVPVGYWLVDYNVSDGFVDGGEHYLRRLLTWCQELGMKAVIDLHALPGCQAKGQSFCGKSESEALFLRDPALYERGKRAMLKLAELALAYDRDPTTAGTVLGIELANEPDMNHLEGYPGVFDLVESMVPAVRAILPADRFVILLSFMDSPVKVAPWLAERIAADPANYRNVAFDKHLYHSFGDTSFIHNNTDTCKTCCRDKGYLEPLVSRGIPIVLGEWSLASGFQGSGGGNDDLNRHFTEQLSHFANTPGMLGSFFWNFALVEHPDNQFLEWSLLRLIKEVPLTRVPEVDVSRVCPKQQLCRCPALAAPNSPDWLAWPPPACNFQEVDCEDINV